MTSTTFDTLMYAKKLREAGFSEKQAEIQAEALKEIIQDNLATKQDISDLRKDLLQIEERLMYRLTIRLGLMLVTAVTVLAAIIKL